MPAPSAAEAHLPRPAWADLSARAELSPARRRVLAAVEEATGPVTAAQVARNLDLHHNTVREHLDALVEAGLVTASASSTGRRGRPALHYAPTGPDPAQVVGSYLALLDAIVEQLGDGEQARRQALAIGRRWAQFTPNDPAASPAEATPTAQLAALLPHLSLMGFAPEFDGEQVVLKACPLMTAARPPHALVCLMHQGFLNERYGKASADASRSDDAVDVPAGSIRFSVAPLCADGCHVTATAVTEAAPAHAKRFPALKR